MTIGDKVRATFPYGGVPACDGIIIKEQVLGNRGTQYLVSFEVRPNAFKKFNLTERELTLCSEEEVEADVESEIAAEAEIKVEQS